MTELYDYLRELGIPADFAEAKKAGLFLYERDLVSGKLPAITSKKNGRKTKLVVIMPLDIVQIKGEPKQCFITHHVTGPETGRAIKMAARRMKSMLHEIGITDLPAAFAAL